MDTTVLQQPHVLGLLATQVEARAGLVHSAPPADDAGLDKTRTGGMHG